MDSQDNECSRAHAPPNLYLSDESGRRSRAGTTGSNESGIAMTASPSHDTKELNFNLGTSPTRKGDMLKYFTNTANTTVYASMQYRT